MPPQLTEQQIREIIRQEIGSFFRSDRFTFEKSIQIADAQNIQLGIGTGTKIGTATTQKIGLFNTTPVIQQVGGVTLTNDVTAGGVTNTISSYSIIDYATDASYIRNNLYQLARKLKLVVDALRTYGFLSNSDS